MSKPSLLRRASFRDLEWHHPDQVGAVQHPVPAMLVLIYVVYVGGAPEPYRSRRRCCSTLWAPSSIRNHRVMPLQALLVEPSPADHEVLLRDVIEAIEYARDDPAINSLVMELDQLAYVGISKTQEIVRALESFRESGKPIVAVGDYFTQDQYLLASHADEIIAHPMGGVALEGFSQLS